MPSSLTTSPRELLSHINNQAMAGRSNPRYSPFSPGPDDRNSNAENSPWSAQSEQDYEPFNLPPIDDLFDQAQYFDALPRFPSPNPFFEQPSQSQLQNDPPPSNQQARRPSQHISQYRVAGSESPDPFDDFLDIPSPREDPAMPTTRSSSVVDLTASSPPNLSAALAPPTGRKRKASSPGGGRASKAARPSSSSSTRQQSVDDDIQVVDLVDVEDDKQYQALRAKEQAELIKAQNEAEANKPVRLAAFECIICMSNPTDLTVTHCGHLFCSECLHHALHAGDKKCCPVCRTVINPGKPGQKTPKTGVFALEMKLMTAKRMGKQAVKTQ